MPHIDCIQSSKKTCRQASAIWDKKYCVSDLSASTIFQTKLAAGRILSTEDEYRKGVVVVPTQSITRHNKSVPLSYV